MGAPEWEGPSSGGGAPSGAAGGDLAGTYPNPTLGSAVVDAANVNTAEVPTLAAANTFQPASNIIPVSIRAFSGASVRTFRVLRGSDGFEILAVNDGSADVVMGYTATVVGRLTAGDITSGGRIALIDTSDPTPGSGYGFIYSKDTAGTSKVYVMGEAGIAVPLTSHPTDAPSAMYDMAPGVERFDCSIHYYRGEITWSNWTRMSRKLDGEQLGKCYMVESFAAYEKRTGDKLVKRDWDADQQAQAAERDSQIAEQKKRKAKTPKSEWKETDLKPHVKKPKPGFVK